MFVDDSAAPSQTPSRAHLSTDHNNSTATSPGQETAASQRANNTEASPQKDAAETGNNREAESEAVVPFAVFVGLQSAASAPADTVIESGGTTPVANPPASLPGETASLALARVAQDTETQDTQIVGGTPGQTAPQAPVDASTADQPAQNTPPVPAVVAQDEAEANAALETAADLTSRIPTEASAVEANAKLQAIVAGTADPTHEPGRLIASASAQPLLAPLKPSSSADTQSVAPVESQEPKPSDLDAKAADSRPLEARQSSAQNANGPDNAQIEPQTSDKPAAPHSSADTDNGAPTEVVPGALPAHTHLQASANAQLTATPANPNVAVPVTALAVEIATNVQIGRSRFEIRLDPPELGRIEVKLDVDRQGQVTSHIIVEKPATLDLLRRDAPQLERALQDAGLKTSDNGLQFSLRDHQSQSGRQDDQQRRDMQRLMITEDETVPRETAGRSYGRMLSASGGIDMRV